MLAVPRPILDLLRLEAGATVGLCCDGELSDRSASNRSRDTRSMSCWRSANLMIQISQEDRAWLDLRPDRPGVVKRGDIYLVSLDPVQGHEQQGTGRCCLVSPDRFNTFTHVPIVVPITSGGSFARNAGFTVSLGGVRDANQWSDPLRPAAASRFGCAQWAQTGKCAAAHTRRRARQAHHPFHLIAACGTTPARPVPVPGEWQSRDATAAITWSRRAITSAALAPPRLMSASVWRLEIPALPSA